ncbi:MAG TPA: NAD(P)H-dependent oxidoreductase [Bacteroidia bacterium]|nr:NAD(P)H-dependent oxidoreductase [Bacteroidia bacterium]
MQKITVISATNRENSYTEKVANYYKSKLEALGKDVRVLSLKKLQELVDLNEIYVKTKSEAFNEMVKEFIIEADAFVFIVPEYNGSFPGVVKVFIDAVHPSNWHEKSVCLTGVSSGRAGNLRGMEHLTSILHYLKLHVYHNRLPISAVDKIFAEGNMPEATAKDIEKQREGFLKFS